MARTLYDSTNPSVIPVDAFKAGYVDGDFQWPSLVGVAVKIAVFSSTNDGNAGDVETGDMTPQTAVSWVQMRRTEGIDPTIYCNLSTYPSVRDAFIAANVPLPWFWIADYSIQPSLNLVPRQVAHQYADSVTSGGDYDLSITVDSWPGVDLGTGGTNVGFLTVDPTQTTFDELYVSGGEAQWGVFVGGAGQWSGQSTTLTNLGSPMNAKDLVKTDGVFGVYQGVTRLNVRGVRKDGSRWIKVLNRSTFAVISDWSTAASGPAEDLQTGPAGPAGPAGPPGPNTDETLRTYLANGPK